MKLKKTEQWKKQRGKSRGASRGMCPLRDWDLHLLHESQCVGVGHSVEVHFFQLYHEWIKITFRVVDNYVRPMLRIPGDSHKYQHKRSQRCSIVLKPICFPLFLHKDPQSHTRISLQFTSHFIWELGTYTRPLHLLCLLELLRQRNRKSLQSKQLWQRSVESGKLN